MEKFAERDGLSTEFVWCLLEDREHNVWVGTQNGLNRFRDEKVVTLTRREGLAGFWEMTEVQTKTVSKQGFTPSSARRPMSGLGESLVDTIYWT